jgi:coniferyl-aldehyde dehydrogenase
VVGIVSPWNFPVNLCFGPLAGVFAAGNSAMLKPSELTPATADWMAAAVPRYFAPEELAVVTGGLEVAREFTALDFDHLVFTGGERAAREVLAAAAQHMTPVTLELGGKSPVIICSEKGMALAARRVLFGKVFNAGQICLAPDTVWVPEQLLSAFIAAVEQAAVDQLSQAQQDTVDIIHSGHLQRLQGYLDEVIAGGGRVIPLLETPERPGAIAPTLIVDPPAHMRVCKEEIFGPLMVVHSYQSLTELLDAQRALPKPLALYCFGASKAQKQQLLRESYSGGLCFDDVIMHYTVSDLPFGGVGNSGMGCYHGVDGFREFSHGRAVFQQSLFDVGAIMRPPYGKAFDSLAAFMQRFM